MRFAVAAAMLLAAAAPAAAPEASPAAFSAWPPGAPVPSGWREIRLPQVKPPEFALVESDGATVLRVRSAAAGGALAHSFDPGRGAVSRLAWRWRVDRVLDNADLARKAGDDFAARVYVFFEVPESELGLLERVKIGLARAVFGVEVPTAALCYVWDNRHRVGTVRPNPSARTVRTFVLRSGAAQAGQWMAESRDLEADFRQAFPERGSGPAPRATGVAVGNDTDQTLESVTAWFGDLRAEPAR